MESKAEKLNRIAQDCIIDLDGVGIKTGRVLAFEVNTRAANRWGQCKKTPNGYIININAVLLDDRNGDEGLINTLYHELLHTCAGCMDHGEKWKRYAAQVKARLGYNIKRTSSAAEKLSAEMQTEEARRESDRRAHSKKYILKCEKCGSELCRATFSKVIQSPELYRCGKCGGEFRRIK